MNATTSIRPSDKTERLLHIQALCERIQESGTLDVGDSDALRFAARDLLALEPENTDDEVNIRLALDAADQGLQYLLDGTPDWDYAEEVATYERAIGQKWPPQIRADLTDADIPF